MVNVVGGSGRWRRASAAIRLESSPAERKTATGTSETRCARTESSTAAAGSIGAGSAISKGTGSSTRPSRTRRKFPAGSARTARRMVNGSGTDPQRRKPATPAGSTSRETAPPASSAFTCEAKRRHPPPVET